jgi:hypothetical protein
VVVPLAKKVNSLTNWHGRIKNVLLENGQKLLGEL